MNVTVQMEFKADRKEPLGALLRRVAAQFEQSGLQPQILATFSDSPGGIRTTSAVERAIRKHPHLTHLERKDSPLQGAGIPPIRRLTNGDPSNPFPMADILALADGVPRSLPFHAVTVHFGHADFGNAGFPPGLSPPTGIAIGDSWWVNGRNRSLSALYSVDANTGSKKLPDPPPAIAAILAGLGKPKRTAQFMPPGAASAATGAAADASTPPLPAAFTEVRAILTKYRSDLRSLVERLALPHDLPPASEAARTSRGASGPLKPTLVEVFAPRGYDCRGRSGTFTMRRRTGSNHIVDVELDVGTWSRSVTFMFHVRTPGINATLMPPVTARSDWRQYPIGDTENWKQIVENVAAIVDELERTFLVEVEAAVDPAPEWFEPGR
jgi:hypothetical protein